MQADKAISRPEYKSGAEDIWLPNPDEFRRPFRRSGVRKSTVSEGSINPSGEHSQEQARQDSCNDCPSIYPGNLQGSNLNLVRSTLLVLLRSHVKSLISHYGRTFINLWVSCLNLQPKHCKLTVGFGPIFRRMLDLVCVCQC